MLAVPLQALHQGRRFSESTALHHVHPDAEGQRFAEAAETRLAQKTVTATEYIERPHPFRQKREIGELSER